MSDSKTCAIVVAAFHNLFTPDLIKLKNFICNLSLLCMHAASKNSHLAISLSGGGGGGLCKNTKEQRDLFP